MRRKAAGKQKLKIDFYCFVPVSSFGIARRSFRGEWAGRQEDNNTPWIVVIAGWKLLCPLFLTVDWSFVDRRARTQCAVIYSATLSLSLLLEFHSALTWSVDDLSPPWTQSVCSVYSVLWLVLCVKNVHWILVLRSGTNPYAGYWGYRTFTS